MSSEEFIVKSIVIFGWRRTKIIAVIAYVLLCGDIVMSGESSRFGCEAFRVPRGGSTIGCDIYFFLETFLLSLTLFFNNDNLYPFLIYLCTEETSKC